MFFLSSCLFFYIWNWNEMKHRTRHAILLRELLLAVLFFAALFFWYLIVAKPGDNKFIGRNEWAEKNSIWDNSFEMALAHSFTPFAKLLMAIVDIQLWSRAFLATWVARHKQIAMIMNVIEKRWWNVEVKFWRQMHRDHSAVTRIGEMRWRNVYTWASNRVMANNIIN